MPRFSGFAPIEAGMSFRKITKNSRFIQEPVSLHCVDADTVGTEIFNFQKETT
jgi:hypothetical protein